MKTLTSIFIVVVLLVFVSCGRTKSYEPDEAFAENDSTGYIDIDTIKGIIGDNTAMHTIEVVSGKDTFDIRKDNDTQGNGSLLVGKDITVVTQYIDGVRYALQYSTSGQGKQAEDIKTDIDEEIKDYPTHTSNNQDLDSLDFL